MPDLKSFFSYKGRLGRLQYFLRQGDVCIIFALLGHSLETPEGMFVSAFVQNILISLLMIARFHDLDKPGYWVIIPFVCDMITMALIFNGSMNIMAASPKINKNSQLPFSQLAIFIY